MRTSIKILLLTVTSFLFVENVLRAQSWTAASPNIYFTGGNVGIGTTSPSELLHLGGTTNKCIRINSSTGNAAFYGSYLDYLIFGVNRNPANGSIVDVSKATADIALYGAAGNGYIVMETTNTNNTAPSERVRITGDGNVGIGTTGPNAKLEVSGSATPGIFVSSTNYPGAYRTQLGTQSGAQGILVLGNNGANEIRFGSTAAGGAGSIYVNNTADYTTAVAGTLAMYFKSDGNIGIGTTSPLAKLHVNNGSLLFDGTTGTTPTSGAGTRMMWIPAKGAFRAGSVTGTSWDDVNIGPYSVAGGYNTIANNSYTVAFGQTTSALATGASAFGITTTASGAGSTALGGTTTASGAYSTTLGFNTTGQPYCSFVTGRYNIISGNNLIWVDTDPLFVIGNGTGTSTRANAITVLKNGKTLIGNPALAGFMGTPDGYLLFVQQGILAEKVKVAVATTAYWSDYVFDEKYKLKSIEDLESFVKTNKHLPNIPSAEEVVKNGIDMATMDAKLLEKIEELSLYIIQQNKRIEALEKKALYKK